MDFQKDIHGPSVRKQQEEEKVLSERNKILKHPESDFIIPMTYAVKPNSMTGYEDKLEKLLNHGR